MVAAVPHRNDNPNSAVVPRSEGAIPRDTEVVNAHDKYRLGNEHEVALLEIGLETRRSKSVSMHRRPKGGMCVLENSLRSR